MTTEYRTEMTGRILTEPAYVEARGDQDLHTYFTLLEGLGLECPSVEAAETWARARHMGASRNRARSESFDLTTVARDLGRGTVTDKEAEKAVFSSVSSEHRVAKVKLYEVAQREAIRACRETLRDAGDQLLESPRAVIDRALSDPDHVDSEELFTAGVRLLTMLHDFGVPRVEGARTSEYLYARPDLVEGGEAPTLRDRAANAGEWKPGVYSATEVLENAKLYAPQVFKSQHAA